MALSSFKLWIACLAICHALVAQSQPNSPAATMLVNGSAGTVSARLGDVLTLEFQGAPGSAVILAVGGQSQSAIALAPGQLYELDATASLVFDGRLTPGLRIPSSGTLRWETQLPWIGGLGYSLAAQAAVEDQQSPIGLSLTQTTTVTTIGRPTTSAQSFFDPLVGARGVGLSLPLAGTAPGDLPTLNRFGFPGAPDITDGGQPVHNVFQSPFFCYTCHGSIQEIWPEYMGSMMANSGRDPLFHAQFAIAVAGLEAAHARGLSPEGGELAADFCIRCHSPAAWQGGRSGFLGDGINAPYQVGYYDHQKGIDTEGVSCDVCHRIEDVVGNVSPTAHVLPGHPDSSQIVFGTSLAKRGPFPGTHSFPGASRTNYGAILGDTTGTSQPNVPHNPPLQEGTAFSPVHETEANPIFRDSTMCASCHNITNPISGHAIERTYTEWLDSDFGDPNSSSFQSCQECHMPAAPQRPACSLAGQHPTYGAFAKIREEIRRHTFVGGNAWIPQVMKVLYPDVDAPWVSGQNYAGTRHNGPASRNANWDQTTQAAIAQLRRSATIELNATEFTPGQVDAMVRIVNETGHKLPTGYPEGRQMWIHLVAQDAQGQTIFESGALDHNHALIRDPALKVYEAKQGLNYPRVGWQGTSFHFALNNAIYKDNRIPPRGAGRRPGLGGNDSYDPVLAPYPQGGLYPPGQHWDDTHYRIAIPASAARPLRITATVYYQTSSYEYIQFLANGGDAIVQTLPAPEAQQLLQLWHNGLPAPAVPVGQVGAGSLADPQATHAGQTALVVVP